MKNDQTTKQVEYTSEEVSGHFINAFAHVSKNLLPEERKEVYAYVLELVSTSNLYTRLSPDPFAALISEIYSSTAIRDFISTVQSVFIGRWLQGRGKDVLYSLVEDLSLSMSYDLDLGLNDTSPDFTKVVESCAIPVPVRADLTTATRVQWLIHANPILISVILIQQYINLDSFSSDTV